MEGCDQAAPAAGWSRPRRPAGWTGRSPASADAPPAPASWPAPAASRWDGRARGSPASRPAGSADAGSRGRRRTGPAASGCTGRRRGTAAARSGSRPAAVMPCAARGDRHVRQQVGLRVDRGPGRGRWCPRCRPAGPARPGRPGAARGHAPCLASVSDRMHREACRRRQLAPRRAQAASCTRWRGAQSASSASHSAGASRKFSGSRMAPMRARANSRTSWPGWLAPSQATRSPGRTPQPCQSRAAGARSAARARHSAAVRLRSARPRHRVAPHAQPPVPRRARRWGRHRHLPNFTAASTAAMGAATMRICSLESEKP